MIASTSAGSSGPPSRRPKAAIAVPGRPRAIPARRKASEAEARKVGERSEGALSAT
jgi:hypothetical protein